MVESQIEQFDPEPWDQQIDERKSQFRAFEYYHAMGKGRAFSDMHKNIDESGGKLSYQDLRAMAENWDWEARVIAKDIHDYVRSQEEFEKELDAMDERHLTMVNAIQARVANTLNSTLQEVLSPQELSNWLKLSTELEKESRK